MTEEEIDEKVKQIVSRCVSTREHFLGSSKGGQQTNGPAPVGCTITHPDFNIVIFYNERRLFTDNALHALSLFATAIKGLEVIPDKYG